VRGRLRRLPISLITDEFAFSMAAEGWHPFVALLDGLRRSGDPDAITDYERFFQSNVVRNVRNLNDVLDLGRHGTTFGQLPRFWLGTYPWGGIAGDQIGRPGPSFGLAHDTATGANTAELWGRDRTMWYGPGSSSTLANERRLTVELASSIGSGYRPIKARGFPRLTVLQRADGQFRAVVVDGHHRLAVLAHLGVTHLIAEIDGVVLERDAEQWLHVASGRCSPSEARRFFHAFFELDGSERFNRVSSEWR